VLLETLKEKKRVNRNGKMPSQKNQIQEIRLGWAVENLRAQLKAYLPQESSPGIFGGAGKKHMKNPGWGKLRSAKDR